MRTNKVSNNQPAFGMVYVRVKNNGRTGFVKECQKLASSLASEPRKDLIGAGFTPFSKIQKNFYQFIVQCRRKNPSSLAPSYNAETEVVSRINNWAKKKGFGKVEFDRE